MRPPPITLERCIEQARVARDAAAIASNPRERDRLVHVAAAYEALAAKAVEERAQAAAGGPAASARP